MTSETQSRHVVRACPGCFREFPPEVRFCGICGETLIERTVTQPLESIVPSQESSYLGATIDNRYRIKRLVGRGGMGTVYEVEHIHMQKTLAMKLLHEDMVVRKQLVGRFTREARAISRLSNEHTVRVYDFGRHQAVFFLVMEFLAGEDLEVILSREGALDWRRALQILDQICESLDEAHSAGIIHRDLKPENIMILSEPPGSDYVKVLDFGLAKISNTEDVFSVHSHRDLFGTPFYMSPEQIRAEGLDHRADIYSLGCLAFRLVTNQHVYDAPYAFDVLRQHLTSPIPSAARVRPDLTIPSRIDRMIWRALAKRPENRYPNAQAMRQEIAGCLADPDGESLPMPSTVPEAHGSLELDDELKARLRAFEASHREAEARMDDAPPELPEMEIPLGVMSFDDSGDGTPVPPPAVLKEPTVETSVEAVARAISPAPSGRSPIVGRPIDGIGDGDDGSTSHENEHGDYETFGDGYASGAAGDSNGGYAGAGHERGYGERGLVDHSAEFDDDDPAGPDDGAPGYARTLKRNRQLRLGAGVLALGAAVAGVIVFAGGSGSGGGGAETEPNNHPNTANLIEAGVPITGHVGERLSTFEPDRDVYKLATGAPGRYLELELSPISNLDLQVDILEPSGRLLGRIDVDGIGEPEILHRFRVPSDEVFLVVSEAKAGDAHPTENVTDTYTLTARLLDSLDSPGETEPNNDAANANRYEPGEQVVGYLDGPQDVDFFQVAPRKGADARRWSIAVEAADGLVPRIAIYRTSGPDGVLVFADEGRAGLLRTYYEDTQAPADGYLIAVAHAGRGTRRGEYKLVADLQPAKSRIAEEPNDDRSRATSIAIGQSVHGVIDDADDVDVFAIPVTDPRYREVEVLIDGAVREKVRLSLSDLNKTTVREYPRRISGDRAVPQPVGVGAGPIRFRGAGETYYLSVRSRDGQPGGEYSFRVLRVMSDEPARPVGGPGY